MLGPYKKDKGVIMTNCYINNEQKIIGFCDTSAIFNIIVPAEWTIKRYHGAFPSDEQQLGWMIQHPYFTETLTENRILD